MTCLIITTLPYRADGHIISDDSMSTLKYRHAGAPGGAAAHFAERVKPDPPLPAGVVGPI
jgi:hypothetical protein